ncbi:hypothetical protein ACFXJ8_13045 [Nonomuraea sp. NPDC059194]|uniref:hypothetical protein n=1 Tax=Nonomuraea sp. NPDC059194 TaxID=3346764 RepID=UPI0036905F03
MSNAQWPISAALAGLLACLLGMVPLVKSNGAVGAAAFVVAVLALGVDLAMAGSWGSARRPGSAGHGYSPTRAT